MKKTMDKERKRQVLITTVVTLIPIIAGILLWNKLPDRIATHFDSHGVADGWSGKWFTVWGLPLIMTVAHLFMIIAISNDPKSRNIGRKMFTICCWIVPVISCVVMSSIYALALGTSLNVSAVTDILVGVSLLVLGNYMTKAHQNYTVGIRIPWTLNSRENWNKTHRLGGKVFMVAGIIFIFNMFLQQFWIATAAIFAAIVIPVIYSFVLYKKGI